MKRFILLILFLILSLASCSGGKSATKSSDSNSDATTVNSVSEEHLNDISDFSGEASPSELSVLLTNSNLDCSTGNLIVFNGTNWVCQAPAAASSPNLLWEQTGSDIKYEDGNVGIGIGAGSPAAKLEVGGTPGTDGIMFPDGSLQTSANQVVIKVKETTESRSNTTALAADSDLHFDIGPNETWEFQFQLGIVISSGTPDIALDFDIPASQDLFSAYAWGPTNNMVGFKEAFRWYDFNVLAADFSINYTGAVDTFLNVTGIIKTSSTGGTVSVRWAQANSNATPTSVIAGSYLKATQIND